MKKINYICAILMIWLPFCLKAQGLQVNSGRGLHVVATGPLQLVFNNGNFINNGNFAGGNNSTVLFTGSGVTGNSSIGGSGKTSIYNLILNKAANDLQLDNNITVTGNLLMQTGNLQLNNYLLDLGSTGNITGERNSARITGLNGGMVRITSVLNAPQAVNPGHIGVDITSDADMGTTVITRGHMAQVNTTGDLSIERWFNIAPERNANLNATLRFWYLDAEVGMNNKNTLTVFSRRENGANWSVKGKDNSDISANWVLKGKLDQLTNYTLARNINSSLGKQGTKTSLQVFPNPYIDHFRLMLVSDVEKDEIVSLIDQNGHVLEMRKVHWLPGVNTVEWNEGKYAAGVYYLRFGSDASSLKIIKE